MEKRQAFIFNWTMDAVSLYRKGYCIDRLKADGAVGRLQIESDSVQVSSFLMGSIPPVANPISPAALKREGEQNFLVPCTPENAYHVQSMMAVKSLAGAVVEASKSMKYQGLLLKKRKQSFWTNFTIKNKTNQRQMRRFQLLLDYNAHLYKSSWENFRRSVRHQPLYWKREVLHRPTPSHHRLWSWLPFGSSPFPEKLGI